MLIICDIKTSSQALKLEAYKMKKPSFTKSYKSLLVHYQPDTFSKYGQGKKQNRRVNDNNGDNRDNRDNNHNHNHNPHGDNDVDNRDNDGDSPLKNNDFNHSTSLWQPIQHSEWLSTVLTPLVQFVEIVKFSMSPHKTYSHFFC